MKNSAWILVGGTVAAVLAACTSTEEQRAPGQNNRYGYQGTDTQFAATPTPTPEATPETGETPALAAPTPTPQTQQGSLTPPTGELPYGTPVPGKPGFVTSPHAPYAGYVDVRGFPPGKDVFCPWTNKIFLVP